LNLTHQFVQQLDDNIREAVFGNVGTMVAYRVGAEDTESLVKQFEPVFSEYDLLNLERFSAMVRLLADGTPQRPFSLRAEPPPEGGEPARRDAVRKWSRETYGRPVDVVEEKILERFAPPDQPTKKKPEDQGSDDYLSESLFDVS